MLQIIPVINKCTFFIHIVICYYCNIWLGSQSRAENTLHSRPIYRANMNNCVHRVEPSSCVTLSSYTYSKKKSSYAFFFPVQSKSSILVV